MDVSTPATRCGSWANWRRYSVVVGTLTFGVSLHPFHSSWKGRHLTGHLLSLTSHEELGFSIASLEQLSDRPYLPPCFLRILPAKTLRQHLSRGAGRSA